MASAPSMGYGPIGGTLPWGSGGGSALQGLNGSNPLGALASNYASGYGSALAQNQAMYGNIMAGYQGLTASQQNAQNDVNSGWTGLQNQVSGLLSTQGQNQAQQIQNQFTASGGALQQSDVNRGLGNTTVADSEQRGNNTAAALALNNNSQNYAGLMANSMSQLGSAGLNQQANAYAQNTALGLNQLGFMNSMSAPYPNAGLYAGLAQQYGNRGQQGVLNTGGNGAQGLGYMPTAAPGGYDSGTAMTGGSGIGGGFGSWAGTGAGGSSWNTPSAAYGGNVGAYGSGPAMGGYAAGTGASTLMQGIGSALSGYGGDYGSGGDFGDMGDYGGGGDF